MSVCSSTICSKSGADFLVGSNRLLRFSIGLRKTPADAAGFAPCLNPTAATSRAFERWVFRLLIGTGLVFAHSVMVTPSKPAAFIILSRGETLQRSNQMTVVAPHRPRPRSHTS